MSEWISAEDRKPDEHESVLLFEPTPSGYGLYRVGCWDGRDFNEDQECMVINATHWMPLPEPPGK